jgi:hypothetical protein
VGLEIEFEDEDGEAADGSWQDADADGGGPLRARIARRWRYGVATVGPLTVHLGVALAALVVGAASAAGYTAGRTAQQDRAAALLHLAPVNPFTVAEIALPPATESVQQMLATPWTDEFDQGVALSLVNDGPEPVTVLGGTVTAPEFKAAALTPVKGGSIPSGGISTLRGRAHFVCGDYPVGVPGTVPASPRDSTIAHLTVRTADGVVRTLTLQVDRYSEVAEQSVCLRMPSPQVLSAPTYHDTNGTAGAYTVAMTITNRAPYPLRVQLSATAAQDWQINAGLLVTGENTVDIAAHQTISYTLHVAVANCNSAVQTEVQGYGFDTLVFTDALASPDSLNTRQQDQAIFLADPVHISAYCLLRKR